MTTSDNVRCTKLAVGHSGGAGTVETTGGSLTGMTEYWGVSVGDNGGNGEFRQSGCAVTLQNRILVGHSNGAGIYRISDGTLNVGPTSRYRGQRSPLG